MCGIAGFYRNQGGITSDCKAVVSKMSERSKMRCQAIKELEENEADNDSIAISDEMMKKWKNKTCSPVKVAST